MSGDIEVIWIGRGSVHYAGERDLRYCVLRAPLGMPRGSEENKDEERCAHCVAVRDGAVVGCVLWLGDSDGRAGKLLQMAVDLAERGRQTGARLVRELERRAQELGFEEVYMHARETAIGFYEKLGYGVSGEPFSEVGLPHRYMSRRLASR
jgi:N-acetylglutamate synthase-like GNAT family acetyltransferase